MANTQTSVPLFVSNAILTAAQQNISAATGVPVFATTVTRDAAFGGANKALAEGQLCYLESTNVVQYYDGAAWATVGPASASALVRVGGGTLSSTSTTFSAVFSATYNTYLVDVSNLTLGANGNQMSCRLGLNGTPATTNYTSLRTVNNGTVSGVSQSVWEVLQTTNAAGQATQFVITNPAIAVASKIAGSCFAVDDVRQQLFNGTHSTATAFNDLVLLLSAGTFTTGTVNIYGYSLS
jgi:hypothetical protein